MFRVGERGGKDFEKSHFTREVWRQSSKLGHSVCLLTFDGLRLGADHDRCERVDLDGLKGKRFEKSSCPIFLHICQLPLAIATVHVQLDSFRANLP
jgi:hypothetical protein